MNLLNPQQHLVSWVFRRQNKEEFNQVHDESAFCQSVDLGSEINCFEFL